MWYMDRMSRFIINYSLREDGKENKERYIWREFVGVVVL